MGRRRRGREINGILLLDKPQGMSSNAALQAVKRVYDARKAGHTGSLDPLATGLLPLCFGEATKVSAYLLDADKSYEAVMRLGITTTTGDSEGELKEQRPTDNINESRIAETLNNFRGEIKQIPPMFSALKRNGQPLYKLARQGIEIDREPRSVRIHSLELLDWRGENLRVAVRCSKGTYIRTLAEDIGASLGCGAHLVSLRRTSTGPFTIDGATTLDFIQNNRQQPATLATLLLACDSALTAVPAVELGSEEARMVMQGNRVNPLRRCAVGMVRMYGPSSSFLGIGEITPDGLVAPRRIMSSTREMTEICGENA